MKKISLITAITFLLALPVAASAANVVTFFKSAAVTCLGNENEGFEGVGAPTNWTVEDGTADFDYSDAPLECTESLRLGSGNDTITNAVKYDPSYDEIERYWSFWLKPHDPSGSTSNYILQISDSAGAMLADLKYNDTGLLKCYANGGTIKVSTISVDYTKTNKLKIYYKADSNGVASTLTAWVWNGSSWDQACSSNNGTSTTNIDRIFFMKSANTYYQIFDYLKDSATDITSPD